MLRIQDFRHSLGRPRPQPGHLSCPLPAPERGDRVRREHCHAEKLVAFSCKKRGFCPSCGARRIAETAALLADEVMPERPLRQWVLSMPHALRFLLATDPQALTLVLGVVYWTISRHLLRKAGLACVSGHAGAVTLVQRFGSALKQRDLQRLLNPVAGRVVARVGGTAAALKQPVTGTVLPARRAGKDLAVFQHGFTDDFLARVVALVAIA